VYAGDEQHDGDAHCLRHVHAIEERRGAAQEGEEPDERVTDAMSQDEPEARQDGEARKQCRRHFRAEPNIAEPREGNLQHVEEQMMIDVILRVQRRQREPREGGRKLPPLDSFPEQLAPTDVIVTVIITAADCARRELQPPEDQPYDHRADAEIQPRPRPLAGQSAPLNSRFRRARRFAGDTVAEFLDALHENNNSLCRV